MPTDLTGTPTTLGIGTYNVDNDAPSGLGFNAAMGQIDSLLQGRVTVPSSPISGDAPVWNGTTWVVPTGSKTGTKALLDGGVWGYPDINRVYGTRAVAASQFSTAGASFAGGTDLLSSALTFAADGIGSYLVRVFAPAWFSTGGIACLGINFDGAQYPSGNEIASVDTSQVPLNASGLIVTPAAGNHTLNVRMWAHSGTNATIETTTGSSFTIVVSVERM